MCKEKIRVFRTEMIKLKSALLLIFSCIMRDMLSVNTAYSFYLTDMPSQQVTFVRYAMSKVDHATDFTISKYQCSNQIWPLEFMSGDTRQHVHSYFNLWFLKPFSVRLILQRPSVEPWLTVTGKIETKALGTQFRRGSIVTLVTGTGDFFRELKW